MDNVRPATYKWYVVQVCTGQEDKALKSMLNKVDHHILNAAFIPRREAARHFPQGWATIQETLFPGYVFAETVYPEELSACLKSVPSFTRLLKSDCSFMPLDRNEVSFLKGFGGEEHIVRMSRAVEEGDTVKVFEGPLKDHEVLIQSINRHKRTAFVQVFMFGSIRSVRIGLEVLHAS